MKIVTTSLHITYHNSPPRMKTFYISSTFMLPLILVMADKYFFLISSVARVVDSASRFT